MRIIKNNNKKSSNLMLIIFLTPYNVYLILVYEPTGELYYDYPYQTGTLNIFF